MPNIPAITGNQLIKLLKKDGWESFGGKGSHLKLKKSFDDRTRVTVVVETNDSLPKGTLGAILSHKQTDIGTEGLLKLIEKYGL
ncbi:type II toxin-antitoxin system HicA family toxin [candidate division KSB1 bacterium]|nr:type II toxin-antitoxin system HicA family toxin [candidate division KSB1 bacterium]